MKKYFLLAMSVLLSLSLLSCSSSKRHKGVPITEAETEVSIPLNGVEYQSNADFWRATQSAISTDVSMAKKIAMQNTRQELATMINSEVKGVMENYGENAEVEMDTQREAVYQELVRTVVDQQLNSVEAVGEKLYRLADGKYRYHICLQVNKAEFRTHLIDVLASESRMKLHFNKERFEQVFNEEMKQLKK